MPNFHINDLVEFNDYDNRRILATVAGFPTSEHYPHLADPKQFVLVNDNISTFSIHISHLTLIRSFNDLFSVSKGNIWDDFDELDYICITTNSILKTNGELVMGKGIAKQAANHCPHLPTIFGQLIKLKNKENSIYGLLAYQKYIAFQTKIDWKNTSPLYVIANSLDKLTRLALKYPNKVFGLPYPGINNGGLTKDQVYPLLKQLPSNVIVYFL